MKPFKYPQKNSHVRLFGFLSLFYVLAFTSCSGDEVLRVNVSNPSEQSRVEVVRFGVSGRQIQAGAELAAEDASGSKQRVELVDADGDGLADEALMQVSLDGGASGEYLLKTANTEVQRVKLTQAELSIKAGGNWNGRKYEGGTFENVQELRVPRQHTDHSYFIRYEGPGWESDKAAYRFYLDWRNGMDFFGKKTQDMVLQTWARMALILIMSLQPGAWTY